MRRNNLDANILLCVGMRSTPIMRKCYIRRVYFTRAMQALTGAAGAGDVEAPHTGSFLAVLDGDGMADPRGVSPAPSGGSRLSLELCQLYHTFVAALPSLATRNLP